MPQHLTQPAREQDQLVVSVAITLSGTADTPTALSWSLTDKDGTVINSRSGTALTPSTSMTVTLAGDDLQIVDRTNSREKRFLIFDGSDSLGNDLYESLSFDVEKVGA